MVIRQETEKDYDEVYAVVKAAFERAEHSDGNEQDLVAALRKGGAFVPELSLVAQKDGRIVGHILLTKGSVGSRETRARALAARLWRQGARPQRPWAMTISPCWGVRTTIPGRATFQRSRWVSGRPLRCRPKISWLCACVKTRAR